jgi:NADH-quinone oxidoreductase subunit J
MIFLSQPSGTITQEVAKSVEAGTIENIGREMFTNYVLPFEAAGYLLLSATIGALVLAKKKFE